MTSVEVMPDFLHETNNEDNFGKEFFNFFHRKLA